MVRVSAAEVYDNRSVIAQINLLKDKVADLEARLEALESAETEE